MNDAIAEMAVKASQRQIKAGKPAVTDAALQQCYGQIGISAVAAAVRYQGAAKNPAYAPATLDIDFYAVEALA